MLLNQLIPWTAKRLEVATPANMWPFNPSIVRFGDRTLCSVRVANYRMPGARPHPDNPPRTFSKMALLELDEGLRTVRQGWVDDRGLSGNHAANKQSRGFEDARLFAIGDKLHASASSTCTSQHSIVEICHLEFGALDAPNAPDPFLSSAKPMRGEWSNTHQKNWMPYVDHPSGEPRWLFSPERGGLHSPDRRITALRDAPAASAQLPIRDAPRPRGGKTYQGRSNEVRILGIGRRIDAARGPGSHGRVPMAMRGGTQLVRVPDGSTWIGMIHGYRPDGERKFYWHALIAVDERGELRGQSGPFKLCGNGIEFAAGLVIDAESRQIAVSYGVDDESAWVGVGALDDAIGLLPQGAVR